MDIRPFTISVPDERLVDLPRRITATKWPDREVDPTQGVQLDVHFIHVPAGTPSASRGHGSS